MKIAVVGSGISGLSSAYFLSKKHKVDLFEKDDHFGGHAYTLKIPYENKKEVAVDIGFMVFNKVTYPNLIKFFIKNNIEIEKSDMSFSVSVKNTEIEYCGKGINGIFSNKKNFFNLKFIKMFFEIINFYNKCEKLKIDKDNSDTLGEYLKKIKISKYFINYHIIPMVSAIWSMPPLEASRMPLNFFLSLAAIISDFVSLSKAMTLVLGNSKIFFVYPPCPKVQSTKVPPLFGEMILNTSSIKTG